MRNMHIPALSIAYGQPTKGVSIIDGWKAYPESAATGLRTTPTDLAKWLVEVQNELNDQSLPPILQKIRQWLS